MIRWPKNQAAPRPESKADLVDLDPPDMVEDWWVIGNDENGEYVTYHGSSSADAEIARKAAAALVDVEGVRILGGGLIYPEPAEAKRCRCKTEALQAECPYGHVGECHYPWGCGQANCRHMRLHKDGDPDALCAKVNILGTDRSFADHASPGDPACVCSRCGKEIKAGEVQVAVEDVQDDPPLYYRYHRGCL